MEEALSGSDSWLAVFLFDAPACLSLVVPPVLVMTLMPPTVCGVCKMHFGWFEGVGELRNRASKLSCDVCNVSVV